MQRDLMGKGIVLIGLVAGLLLCSVQAFQPAPKLYRAQPEDVPPQVVVLAGDPNLNASKSSVTGALARAGFRDVVPTSRVPTTPARHLLEAGRHIDWAFVRGPVQADAGKVHRSVKGSDHYPISFELRSVASCLSRRVEQSKRTG